ncbi:MAG: methyl-accepting chemotaxis protein [Magnetococcus sp. DMHC-1]|nr:chemotaxis protein [Magnetococcales bacterium]
MDNQEQQLAQEIQGQLHLEMDVLRHDAGQIRFLVQDAIVKLTASFNGLRDQSNSQNELVTSLTTSMEGAESSEKPQGDEAQKRINIRQFVSETDRILRSFVDHILLVSRQSMEMVHRIDDLSNQMNEVVNFLHDIDAIAEQTNVLALNARIVSARAGEAGKAFAVVADQVRKLSKDSNQFSQKINQVVRRSQENIESAKEIIEIMASKDMSFAIESKGRVDEMMEEVSKIDRFTAATLVKVSEITERINQDVGTAVMSLQFEDMVTQLVQSLEKHINLMEQFTHVVCCGCLKPGLTDQAARVQAIRETLQEHLDLFAQSSHKPVDQTSMDEGDIELF